MSERKLEGKKIGCVMTGSFCTFKKVFESWKALRDAGAELYPIMSFNACSLDTRFYPACRAVQIFEEICGRKIWNTLEQVEPIGPKKLLDALVVAPCTGNTLAKIACGITDTPAALCVKSHLRNGRPVILAVSTNDGLGASGENIARLRQRKHYYFVPYGQDDPVEKPQSLKADLSLLPAALDAALQGRQLQPMLRMF